MKDIAIRNSATDTIIDKENPGSIGLFNNCMPWLIIKDIKFAIASIILKPLLLSL